MITLLLALNPAHAWDHLGHMFPASDMPITWSMTDYKEDSLPQTPSDKTGMLFQEEVFIKGYCNWHWSDYCEEMLSFEDFGFTQHDDASCADVRFEYLGTDPGNEGRIANGSQKVFWDDPRDQMPTGVIAWAVTSKTNEIVKQQGSRVYYSVQDSDIEFNKDLDFSPDAAIESGCTGSERSVESTATHEIGHLLGMAHSCEEGDLCTDEDFLNATMFWQGPNCDTSRSSIGIDDIEGINALYGPYVDWYSESTTFGAVPLEVCFNLDSDEATIAQITDVTWSFGDGETSDELEPCHEYTTQGQFSVTASISGTGEDCGDWNVKSTQRAFALVCDEPKPAFEVLHFDGLVYQAVNQTDVSTYGCIDGILWEVYKGSGTSGEPVATIGAWSPKIDFTELGEGTYTVLLTAQGPASDEGIQAQAEVEIEDRRGSFSGACSSTTPPAGLAALGLILLGLVRRRR